MKKTLSLLLAAVLAFSCIFAFSGCGKKPMDIDDLQRILEKEGYETYTDEGEEYGVDVDYLTAYNDNIDIEFMEFDEDDEDMKNAITILNDEFDYSMNNVPDGAKVLSSKKTKKHLRMEALDDGDYMFAARIENTFIMCECDEEYMRDAQRILKKIGYR